MLSQLNTSASAPGLGEGEGARDGTLACSYCSRKRDISSARLQSWRAWLSARSLASRTCMALRVSCCWSLLFASANFLYKLATSSWPITGSAGAPSGGFGGFKGGGVAPVLLLSGDGDRCLDLPLGRPRDLDRRPLDGVDALVVRLLALRRPRELLRDLEE